jgi:hypothetical protein
MEVSPPKGKTRKFSDAALRDAMARGVKPADFAREVGTSRQAVNQRVKQLQLTTTSAIVAPNESVAHVRRAFDVMAQLARNVERANLLQDACDEWLRDARTPEKYDLDARADEVEVTYQVEVATQTGFRTEKRKKKLMELMACLEGADDDGARFCGWKHGEFKRADPRELILKTQSETRMTAALVIEALQKLTDARMLEEWRKAVVEEIAKESPEVARRIADRIQRSIVLYAAFAGSGDVPGAN